MTGLLLETLPLDIDADKDREPTKHLIIGERVYNAGLVSALLEHGSYDHYCYLSDKPSGEARGRHDRLRPIDLVTFR